MILDCLFLVLSSNKFIKGEPAKIEFNRATSEGKYYVKEDEICDFFGVDDQGEAGNTFRYWKFYRINSSRLN